MGEIQVLTPVRELVEDNPISRVNSTKVTSDSALVVIPLHQLKVRKNQESKAEKILDLRQINAIKASNSELIWAMGRFQNLPELLG